MNAHLTQRAADVLLISGDMETLADTRSSLQRAKIYNRLHHVGDATEARAYMKREGPYLHAPTPALVLLDTELPGDSARELIADLKSDPQFSGIAVILLTGSQTDSHVVESCAHMPDGQIRKPFYMPDLLDALAEVETLAVLVVQSTSAPAFR